MLIKKNVFLKWLNTFSFSLFFFFQGNSGLKPKDNEMNSKPWHWPINYQVHYIIITQQIKFKSQMSDYSTVESRLSNKSLN